MARKREERSTKHAYRREKQNKKPSGGQEDQNFVTFNNQLATMGLALREVPGDGNCLFRALGDQLEGHTKAHLQHRQETVEYMRQHRLDFEPFVEDDVPFERHVGNLEKAGTYAGNDAIVAFARRHGVTVIIHQLNSPLWKVHGGDPNVPHRELHIAYHNGDHYNSIRRLGDDTENPANVQIASEHMPTSCVEKNQQLAHCYSSYYDDDDQEDDSISDDETNEMVQVVMERSGCMDKTMIEETLADHVYNLESTIDFLLNLKLRCLSANPHQEDACTTISNESLWGPNGTATRIFGSQCSTDSCVEKLSEGGAKQKALRNLTPQQKPEPKKHLSNKQRKETKRQERKHNSELRRRQKSVLSNDISKDFHEIDNILTPLGCLNI